MKRIAAAALASLIVMVTPAYSTDQPLEITSHKVTEPPVIDGNGQEPVWEAIEAETVYDQTAGYNLFIKSAYTDDTLYFCVQYKDTAANPFHKPWLWNEKLNQYASGPHREDTFVFKWNMMPQAVDLSNFSDDTYTADVWYWKANRTNPAGYADDKHQILSNEPGAKATEVISKSNKKRYLYRKSDAGKPAYKELKEAPTEKSEKLIDRYMASTPQGSRGDVRAKGEWRSGFWTIEFARKFNTGNSDDVQFDPQKSGGYLFGVSIYSLYGRPLIMDQPNRYGMGRISEPLVLVFDN